jgi:surface protein
MQKQAKKLLLAASIVCSFVLWGVAHSARAATADDFIITIKTDNPGTSSSTAFTIPTNGAGYSYDVDCDINDGPDPLLIGQTGDATCVYPVAGTYTLAVSGTFPQIFFNYGGDAQKLVSVDQWGTGVWNSMAFAFAGASNMNITALDAPNLTVVTSTSGMFNEAAIVNADLSSWDVSHVTDMSGMFSGALAFNGNISTWNTSQATNMYAMFVAALAFNQDISGWDVSHVTDMSFMFKATPVFNQPIGSWNVSAATNMNSMFFQATGFNQNLASWNTSQVTDMGRMFEGATAFDQNIGTWNVGNLQDATTFLKNSGLSRENYDNLLMGWSAQTVQPDVVFGAGTLQYCAAASRTTLVNPPNNWEITDGGVAPLCDSVNRFVEFSAASASSANETAADNFPVLLVDGTFGSPANVAVVVTGGTAINGTDYVYAVTTTVTIPAGVYDGTTSTAVLIPVPTLINNSTVDGNRTILLSLVSLASGVSVNDADGSDSVQDALIYTITDDDTASSGGCSNNCGGTAFPVASASQGVLVVPIPAAPAPIVTAPPVVVPAGEVLGEKISIIDELILKYDCYTYADGIRQLQTELQKQGYFPATFVPTRYYGNMTRAAVAKYLNDKLDEMSVDELVKFAFKLGQRNRAVKRLQTELKALGYFPASVPATGYRGPITKAAIAKYKAAHK